MLITHLNKPNGVSFNTWQHDNFLLNNIKFYKLEFLFFLNSTFFISQCSTKNLITKNPFLFVLSSFLQIQLVFCFTQHFNALQKFSAVINLLAFARQKYCNDFLSRNNRVYAIVEKWFIFRWLFRDFSLCGALLYEPT